MRKYTFAFPILLTSLLASSPLLCGQDEKNAQEPAPAPQEKPHQQKKADEDHAELKESAKERQARMKWWKDAKFGMFIHWGLYSGLAGDWKGEFKGAEWIQKNAETDTVSYAKAALPLFAPKADFAKEWADLAKEAGCQYAVMTSKHHDGFALFDSAVSDFDSRDKKNRDLVKEYVDAFRAAGIKTGLYHSVIDWHHPAYDNTICPDLCYPAGQAKMLQEKGIPRNHEEYQKYLHAMVKELMTNYGKLDIIWWDYSQGDMSGEKGWKAPELINMVRKLQPGIIMNNRLYSQSGLGDNLPCTLDLRCGDFITPEQKIPADKLEGTDWEACMTIGNNWGYTRYDDKVKSSDELVLKLAECTTKGGNLLLNVNPQADGTIPLATSMAMKNIGAWLKINGEAVYGSTPYACELPEGLAATRKGENVYIFIMAPSDKKWDSDLSLPVPAEFSKAEMLGSSTKLSIATSEETDGKKQAKLSIPKALLGGKTVPVIKLGK